jgi:hypothetical protein
MRAETSRATVLAVAVAVAVLATASTARADAPQLTPLVGAQGPPPAPWTVGTLPHQTKPVTQFSMASLDGRPALKIEANESYGTLGHRLGADAPPARTLAWKWRVDQPIPNADLQRRGGDDTAVKVCAMYDEPDDKVPASEHVPLALARLQAGTKLPAAAVCYVWDSQLPAGTVLPNAFTRRVRYIVLRSKESPLASWAEESRDLHADFLKLFGNETSVVPPLVAIEIGGDTDNTRSHSLAYVADIELRP